MLSPTPGAPTSRLAAVLAGVILALVLASPPVSGHSELRTSRPVDGQTMRRAVTSVEVVFWSPISDVSIDMWGPNGEPIEGQTDQVDAVTARFDMQHPADDPGAYHVTYTSRSGDGDQASGEIAFSYAPDEPSGRGRTAVLVGAALILAVSAVTRTLRRKRR